MLDRQLLKILACPSCKAPLSYDETLEVLKCHNCQRTYPIRDGVPILLIDQATIET